MRLAVLGAVGLALLLVLPGLKVPASFDGVQMYLPLARRLLAEGFGFLRAPESVMFAPLAYMFPALLGASEAAVRWANVLLYLATVVLAFDAVRHAHSPRAGVVAAFVVALAPSLRLYAADVLTEPLFLFAVALWATSVARIAAATDDRAKAWVAIGAIALTIAPLTRPAAMLFAPAMALACLLWAARAPLPDRRVARRLFALHALAIVGPALWILRNAALFGLPSIATGLGNALWLGLNPLVDGFDPLYFGMDFDVGAVARDISHLSIEADRLLKAAALLQLADIPLPVLLQMLAHKALAFLTVTSSEISATLVPQRSWRVAMLVLASCAILWQRRNTLVLALCAFALYMIAVHMPLLYHHRYTIGALDVPLALLAAIGIAESLRDRKRAAVVAVVLVFALGVALAQLADAGPGSPRVERSPGQVLYSRDVAQIESMATENAQADGAGGYVLAPGAAFDIPIAFEERLAGDFTATILGMAVTPIGRHPGCAAMRLRYREAAQAAYPAHRTVRVPLEADGTMRAVVVGTTYPLRLGPNGVLRIELECLYATALRMGRITVVATRRGAVYRERVLGQSGKAGT
jgi:4-amino-4-deoxy-L-arabinose transferase-like glycosyltransferase